MICIIEDSWDTYVGLELADWSHPYYMVSYIGVTFCQLDDCINPWLIFCRFGGSEKCWWNQNPWLVLDTLCSKLLLLIHHHTELHLSMPFCQICTSFKLCRKASVVHQQWRWSCSYPWLELKGSLLPKWATITTISLKSVFGHLLQSLEYNPASKNTSRVLSSQMVVTCTLLSEAGTRCVNTCSIVTFKNLCDSVADNFFQLQIPSWWPSFNFSVALLSVKLQHQAESPCHPVQSAAASWGHLSGWAWDLCDRLMSLHRGLCFSTDCLHILASHPPPPSH